MKGIDLSHHNPPASVPWDGVEFVGVRVTYGTTLDKLAEVHLRAAHDRGITCLLAYHYQNMSAPGDAQARAFLERTHALEDALGLPRLGLATDLEDLPAPAKPWPREEYAAIADAFAVELAEHIRRPLGVYGSPSFLDELVLSARVTSGPLWLAHHTSAPAPRMPRAWSRWAIWQHAVDTLPGGAKIDRNRCRLDPAAWRALWTPPDPHPELGGVVRATRAAMGLGDGADTFVTRDEGPIIE